MMTLSFLHALRHTVNATYLQDAMLRQIALQEGVRASSGEESGVLWWNWGSRGFVRDEQEAQ